MCTKNNTFSKASLDYLYEGMLQSKEILSLMVNRVGRGQQTIIAVCNVNCYYIVTLANLNYSCPQMS